MTSMLDDEVFAWRKVERDRLLEQRAAVPAEERQRLDAALERHLDAALGPLVGRTVGVYWPIKAEPNLRRWMARLDARGARCALPVIRTRAAPLAFLAWRPGAPMVRGFWGIPEPADAPLVAPDLLVAPMVGFDERGYRLGYGGGYYDRTLASLSARPTVVGIAYSWAALPTIHPLAHDIPMDVIVTEQGVFRDDRWPVR